MKIKEIIKWIQKLGNNVVSFVKMKPYVAVILVGAAVAVPIAIVHSHYSNPDEIDVNVDDVNELQRLSDLKMLYDNTLFMSENNIFSDEDREKDIEFLKEIKVSIDDKSISDDDADKLKNLNDILTDIATTNKKSMEDSLAQIQAKYLVITDDNGKQDGYTIINVNSDEKKNYDDIISEIKNDIKSGYFVDANSKLIELSQFLSSHNEATGEVIETKVEPDGTIKVVPIVKNNSNSEDEHPNNIINKQSSTNNEYNKVGAHPESQPNNNVINPNNKAEEIKKSPTNNNQNNNSSNNSSDNPSKPSTDNDKPKAPKYTKEQNDLINSILNEWYDLEITEEEANVKLRNSFSNMTMTTKHIGDEAEARALWNSLGEEYLKSNILISNRFGSYFIYGK